jgi:alkylated DNA repair dioxygenase AlkB
MNDQLGLFDARTRFPAGFRHQLAVITADQERALLDEIRDLPFREFEFHGYLGKRRVVSYGWRYDFEGRTVVATDAIPPFLLDLRVVAGRFADRNPSDFQQVLVSEYHAGAGIGWHKDKAEFGDVVGISLLGRCRFRLRRKLGTRWERVSFDAEPRSAYLLSGPARTEWEHSIPAVDTLRYSVTFRNFRDVAR